MSQVLKVQQHLDFFPAKEDFLRTKFVYLFVAAILVILAFFQTKLFSNIVFPIDDAYITLHNVQVLHQGYDLNYPGVSALRGSTSIIHLFLVSLLAYALPILSAQQVILWLSIIAYAMGIIRLATIYRLANWQIFSLIFLSLCSANLIYQLLNGLETSLALAAIVWALVLVSQPITKKRRILAALLWGLMPFIRPELAIFSGLLWLYQIKIYKQENLSSQAIVKFMLQDTRVALLAMLPWLTWYLLATGWLLPNTMSAKLAFMSELYLPLSVKLHFGLLKFIGFLSLVGVGLTIFGFFLFLSPIGRLSFAFIAIFIGLYVIFIPYELSDNWYRYPTLCLPFLFYGGIIGLTYSQREVRLIANVFLMIALLQAAISVPISWKYYYFFCMQYAHSQLVDVSNWCDTHLPHDATVLVHDTGYIAYATPFHLVDLVGLKSPQVVPYYQKYSLPNNGEHRVEAIAKIIAQEQPQYFVLLPCWDESFHFSDGLPTYGYQLKTIYAQKGGYEVDEIIGSSHQ